MTRCTRNASVFSCLLYAPYYLQLVCDTVHVGLGLQQMFDYILPLVTISSVTIFSYFKYFILKYVII